jgi:hypothetical protein
LRATTKQDRSEASFDVWCFDFWCLVSGVSAVFGVWCVAVFGVWCVNGVWCVDGVWCLVSGGVLPLMKPPFLVVLSHAKYGSVLL